MNQNVKYIPFSKLLSKVIDNRGRSCPTVDRGIPLIATNCIKNNSLYPVFDKVRYVSQDTFDTWFRGHPEPGDIIFVNKGTPGRVCLVPDPLSFCIAQDMVAIRADQSKIYPKYLFAVLRSKKIQDEIGSLHVGSLIPHFKKGDFDDLKIPIVSIKDQKHIGDLYYFISEKVDLLHRQNKTLEQLAETLFRQWFVEEADESWEITTLAEHTEVFRGLSYKGSGLTQYGKGLPMHNLNSVYEFGGYKREGIKYYNGDYRDRHLVDPGDIIVANTEQGHEHRLIGFPGIVPSTFGNLGIFSQHIYRIVPLQHTFLSNQFLYYLLMITQMREQIIGATNGSTVNMLAIDGLQRPEFKLPPKQKVREFTNIVQDYWKKKELNHNQIQILAKLRDSLLPKLMSGEVKIN